MCIDSDTERPESPPPVYISADKDTTIVSSKKGKKPRAPTPYSDSEDTTATGQLSASLLWYSILFSLTYFTTS